MKENDETFACIRCGKQVYYSHSVTYCPYCGLDFLPAGYGEDDDLPELVNSSATPRRFSPVLTTIGSGIIGLSVEGVCYLVCIHIARSFPEFVPLIVAGFLGAFASGYGFRAMSGALPRRVWVTFGVLNTLPPALMFLSARLVLPYILCIVGLCAVLCTLAAFVGGIVYDTLHQRANTHAEAGTSDDALYLDLLQRLGFDHSRVKRMLEMERQNFPKLNQRELLRRAIQRVERDNR